MMISGGKSGKRQVDKYLKVLEGSNLKLSNSGTYRKYNKNGTVCNMGKFQMPDELVLSYSLSGKERPDIDTSASTEYHFQRPPLPRSGGYSTEKPLGLMEAIITRTTKRGEKILDLFAGSGSSMVAALNLGRRIHGLEITSKAINQFILPKMREFESMLPSPACVQVSMPARQTTMFDFL
ncbi:MAG: Type II DNA methyltransferase [uncultured Sulfurovum sp.]|uniref:site-specific DNA-methyltransferase (adenine-specific) n=1 Tax=uncultured Sulfurovum sp. TaxID=269237 RepID=A0A6S6SQ13_9BACT|nr:MAG: Type II DNA methyltransferase [uncultured Sulfurovum sp.]